MQFAVVVLDGFYVLKRIIDVVQQRNLFLFLRTIWRSAPDHCHRVNQFSLGVISSASLVTSSIAILCLTISRGANLESGVVSSLRSYVGPRRTPTGFYVCADDGFGVNDTPVPSR